LLCRKDQSKGFSHGEINRVTGYCQYWKGFHYGRTTAHYQIAAGFEHYEAITRSDTMMMGLLRLWQIYNKPDIELRLIYSDR